MIGLVMTEFSLSKVHFEDEEELWSYYDKCGLSPALNFSGGGRLDYRKITYSLGDMFVCSTSSRSGWGFEKQQSTDVYFVSFTHQGQSTWEMNKQGRVHASGQLCIIDSSRLVEGQFSPGTYTDTVMIEADLVSRQLEGARGFGEFDRVEFKPLLPSTASPWNGLNAIINCIRSSVNSEGGVDSPLAVSYLKQALIATIIDTIPHNFTSKIEAQEKSFVPRHVSKAIDYIHAHAREDVMIADLAKYASTSVRNIQLGFRAYKNTTPMQYLRRVRLECARNELMDENIRLSWQGIALNWGFSDAGLFSKYYKGHYGESPFQTQSKIKGPLR